MTSPWMPAARSTAACTASQALGPAERRRAMSSGATPEASRSAVKRASSAGEP
nr:hypothetical protein [Pseudonocardia pini]